LGFQSLDGTDVENIGYVVPVTVVEHFLGDIARNGKYTGWCSLGVGFQLLENKEFRDYLGMRQGQTGVMLTSVSSPSPSLPVLAAVADAQTSLPADSAAAAAAVGADVTNALLMDDVLLNVDGINVANDGTIPFRRGERVALSSYVSSLFPGDTLRAKVWRRLRRRGTGDNDGDDDGDEAAGGSGSREAVRGEVTLELRLGVAQKVVPHHWDNQAPPYLVCGGLVFTCLSLPYLHAEGAFERFQSTELTYLAHLAVHSYAGAHLVGDQDGSDFGGGGDGSQSPRATRKASGGDEGNLDSGSPRHVEELVLLSLVLAHRANLGYEHLENQHLVRFNGRHVRSLAHLSGMIADAMEHAAKSPPDSFLRFEFAPQGRVVVLNCASAAKATSEICLANGVPAPYQLRKKVNLELPC